MTLKNINNFCVKNHPIKYYFLQNIYEFLMLLRSYGNIKSSLENAYNFLIIFFYKNLKFSFSDGAALHIFKIILFIFALKVSLTFNFVCTFVFQNAILRILTVI